MKTTWVSVCCFAVLVCGCAATRPVLVCGCAAMRPVPVCGYAAMGPVRPMESPGVTDPCDIPVLKVVTTRRIPMDRNGNTEYFGFGSGVSCTYAGQTFDHNDRYDALSVDGVEVKSLFRSYPDADSFFDDFQLIPAIPGAIAPCTTTRPRDGETVYLVGYPTTIAPSRVAQDDREKVIIEGTVVPVEGSEDYVVFVDIGPCDGIGGLSGGAAVMDDGNGYAVFGTVLGTGITKRKFYSVITVGQRELLAVRRLHPQAVYGERHALVGE